MKKNGYASKLGDVICSREGKRKGKQEKWERSWKSGDIMGGGWVWFLTAANIYTQKNLQSNCWEFNNVSFA